MGAITSVATFVGGLMAGTGAAIVAENAVLEHGSLVESIAIL